MRIAHSSKLVRVNRRPRSRLSTCNWYIWCFEECFELLVALQMLHDVISIF